MTLPKARAASVAIALAAAVRLEAAVLEFVPIEGRPAAVLALEAGSEIEAYALAAGGSMAVVSIASAGEPRVSALRYANGGEEPRSVPLSGRLAGLAVVGDGSACYAVVRVAGKKGTLRGVELVRIDLRTARATAVATLPVSAGGLAITPDGATLLVASKDEVRTFSIPAVASGRLYRVPGDNVGAASVRGSSYAVVAQRSRVVLVDLAGHQGREGLELKGEAAAPAPLSGLLASVGEEGPVAMAEGGLAWRVRVGDLPAPPVAAPPPQPVVVAPDEPVLQEPVPVPRVAMPPVAPPPAATEVREIPGEPGTVAGSLSGPAIAEVAAIIFLGPDNVLREAARVVPDQDGRFAASALPPGSYRIVATGKEGRVLICRPPYLSLRVGSNSAVEAPELAVLRAE